MPATHYRIANQNDSPTLAALGRETFVETFGSLYAPKDLEHYLAHNYTDDILRKELDTPDTCFYLAEQNGAAIGYCKLRLCALPVTPPPPQPAYELHRLYVLQRYWQHGTGRRLMELAMEWLAEKQAASIFLGVYSENHRAQKFYAHYGFEKVGEYQYPVGEHRDREFIFQWKSKD